VDEEEVRDGVCDDAVELLRHRPVEAAQPSLDVAHRDLELRRDERRCQRRVDVAGHEHCVRLLSDEDRFEPLHHARGLLRVRAGADVEKVVRLRHRQVVEEDVRHRGVVVLAGVDQHLVDPATPERGDHWSRLHQVRSRADDGQDLPHQRSTLSTCRQSRA